MLKRNLGFTVWDLVVATGVIAVLAALAVPAYGNVVAAGRAAAVRADLLDTIATSVHRAAVTGSVVVLCPSQGTGCLKQEDWSPGWLAFHDRDGDRNWDPGERTVVREGAAPAGTALVSTVGRRRLVFQASGGNAGSNVTFTLCDRRGASKAASLVISNAGRLRAARATPRSAQACLQRLDSRG